MKVLLFTIVAENRALQALESICTWLAKRDIECDHFSDQVVRDEAAEQRFCELHDAIADYDLVCCFGGDGTTLRAAHLISSTEIPLLSYNFGRLGFLSGADEDDLIPAIATALDGNLEIDLRTMLTARITYQDGTVEQQTALNELAVSRGHFGHIVALDFFINGTYLDTIRGDGVLISTPTGSTAYSLSAGGPIISPNHEELCVVPIAPHSLASRAVITARDDVIRIVPNQYNRQPLVLFIDGEALWMQPQTDSVAGQTSGASKGEVVAVEISTCSHKLHLLHHGPYDFYQHISEIFFRGGNA